MDEDSIGADARRDQQLWRPRIIGAEAPMN
jgi:hypothetical protein